MEQQIRFFKTSEGARIAYAIIGEGPVLLLPPYWVSHLEMDWEEPMFRSFYEKLSRHNTLVRYDRRGVGLSDRERTDFSFEAELRDLEELIATLKLEQLILLGISQGGPFAIAYAGKYPDRVSHLILYGSYAYGDALAKDEVKQSLLALIRAHWGVGSRTLAEIFIPHGEIAAVEWFTRWQRESAAADMAASLLAMIYKVDIRHLLSNIRIPTMVIHRKKDRGIPFRLGRELAADIANARFVPLEGDIHLPWLGDTDSVIRAINGFLGHAEAKVETSKEAPSAGAVAEEHAAQEACSLIAGLDVVALCRFLVVGSYARYDDALRNTLKDARQKIMAAFMEPSRKRENYLIWGPPGSGKTYFAQQVAESLSDTLRYQEINLAKCSEQEFASTLSGLETENVPCLCLIDEVDAKHSETWPYEIVLHYLDLGADRGAPFAFVMAGSSGTSITEMKQRIASRAKGNDLLSRIPGINEYEIPAINVGDRILITLSQFRAAGREAGKEVRAVEKFGLYYLTIHPHLANARQLREFAVRGVERMPKGEDRVKYDNLFDPGDPENKQFYLQARPLAESLVNKFVMVED